MQRYSREYFLRILRAEVMIQQDVQNATLKEKLKNEKVR
jgi:hypothetical protein